jgi:DNA-binding transcriptional regulator YiaG
MLVGGGVSSTSATTAPLLLVQEERTLAGIEQVPLFAEVESNSGRIYRLKRQSGLNWDEIAELFDVSRRSVHHWANGKPLVAKQEKRLIELNQFFDQVSEGDALAVRQRLLAHDGGQSSSFNLLINGNFGAAKEQFLSTQGMVAGLHDASRSTRTAADFLLNDPSGLSDPMRGRPAKFIRVRS